MRGLFISYRREDGAGHAGRLFDRLSERFGRDQIFMDVSDIEPGVNFVDAIAAAIASCDVLIAVIGSQWLNCTNEDGTRRIDDRHDFVRLEIALSLERNLRVISVLIRGATMPDPDDLPYDLVELSKRQAIEISDSRWDYDTGRFIRSLERTVAPVSQSRSAGATTSPGGRPACAAFNPDKSARWTTERGSGRSVSRSAMNWLSGPLTGS